jgi:hypothetical protein
MTYYYDNRVQRVEDRRRKNNVCRQDMTKTRTLTDERSMGIWMWSAEYEYVQLL